MLDPKIVADYSVTRAILLIVTVVAGDSVDTFCDNCFMG
jgi:hypothetical protein